jgi:sugar phosphate isomerase/epimerase
MLCYSTGSLPDAFSLSEIAKLLSPTPFRGVELVVTAEMLKHASDGPYWRAVRTDFEKEGLGFRNVHLGDPHLLGPIPHAPGLASLDVVGQSRKLAAVEIAVAIASNLGSPHVTLTTGLPDSEDAMDRHMDSLKMALVNLVRQKPSNLVFLIEQEPEHVIRSTSQLIELGQTFQGDVFINFDVGHSEVMGEDIGSAIGQLGPLLRNIHLEDIKDRIHAHKLYGDGDVDFGAIFTSLRSIGYHGDYTPDLYPFKHDYARAMEASLAFLRQHGVLTKAL